MINEKISTDIKHAAVERVLSPVENVGDDKLLVVALLPPLLVRMVGEGTDAAVQRLLLLLLALVIAFFWAKLFTRRAGTPPPARTLTHLTWWNLAAFAMTFVVLLPGPVAWGAAVLALSFGAVFGREIFGGRAIMPPALIGLAFAIFSFPVGGFESRGLFAQSPDVLLAASCLPGAALLIYRGVLIWQVAAGAVAVVAAAGLLMGVPVWWHLASGTFAAAILFLAAAPESAVVGTAARWVHGLLVGGLTVLIRVADPNQPDGVVFAILLGALFAPLLSRALQWRRTAPPHPAAPS